MSNNSIKDSPVWKEAYAKGKLDQKNYYKESLKTSIQQTNLRDKRVQELESIVHGNNDMSRIDSLLHEINGLRNENANLKKNLDETEENLARVSGETAKRLATRGEELTTEHKREMDEILAQVKTLEAKLEPRDDISQADTASQGSTRRPCSAGSTSSSSRDKLILRISGDLSSVKVTNEHGELIEDDVPAGPSDLQSQLENQKKEHSETLTAAYRERDEHAVKASALQKQLAVAQEELQAEKAISEALAKQAEDLKEGHKKELQAQKSTHGDALSSEKANHENELEAAMQKCKEEVEKAEKKLAKMKAEIKEYQMKLEKATNLEKEMAELMDKLREESEGHEKALEELREQMREQDVAHSEEKMKAIRERDEEAWKAFDLEKKLKAVIENPDSKVRELLAAALQKQKIQLEAAINSENFRPSAAQKRPVAASKKTSAASHRRRLFWRQQLAVLVRQAAVSNYRTALALTRIQAQINF